MIKKGAFIICLIFLFCGSKLLAQEKPYQLLKFGVKGFGGITDTCHLNTLVNEWFEKVVDASNAELESNLFTLPFNIEYGYQPFIIIRPLRFFQIGVKMDYGFSGLTGKFKHPLINQNYTLNFNTKSYIPGVFAYLSLGSLEFGGGIIRCYMNINANDNFFGYNDTWFGANKGYELSLGISSTQKKHVGFTMGIKYRDLFIGDFTDKLNRKISYSNTQENMSLNMSGLIIEIGLYFQLIKMKKQRNET